MIDISSMQTFKPIYRTLDYTIYTHIYGKCMGKKKETRIAAVFSSAGK